MLTLQENPPLVSGPSEGVLHFVGRWWVLHTRPRMEKALAWDLLGRNHQYFLPMRQASFTSSGKRRHGLYPLFPSYLFICGDDDTRIAAISTSRVVSVIDVRDQRQLAVELNDIQQALRVDPALRVDGARQVGTKVRVIAGPFQGIQGIVLERSRKSKLMLAVSMLGQGLTLEIEDELLVPA